MSWPLVYQAVEHLSRIKTCDVHPVQVRYASLPNFEEREEDFRAESVLLRRRFTDEGALHAGTAAGTVVGVSLPHCCLLRRLRHWNLLHLTKLVVLVVHCQNSSKRCALRLRLISTIRRCMRAATEEDSLVHVSEDKLPGQALPLSMQRLWQIIREQKDLNLPAHKVPRLAVHVGALLPSLAEVCWSFGRQMLQGKGAGLNAHCEAV